MALEAVRELDAQVMIKVLGCHPHPKGWSNGFDIFPVDWSPSRDIRAAWEVVEKLQGGLRFELRRRPDGGFWAYFGEELSAEADTAPHAICLAALKAVGV